MWEWLALDEDDRTLVSVYSGYFGGPASIQEVRDAFLGRHDSPEAWAEETLEDQGVLDAVPEELRYHINFKTYARDSGCVFVNHNGDVWVFLP